MERPLVTVIVPIYNVAPYLPQCLDSIAAGGDTSIEVILVNDGSTDGSGNIAHDYAARHDHWHVIDKPNRGLSNARNAALDIARGEWIMPVDSDDYLPPRAIDTLAAHITDDVDIIVGRHISFNDGTTPSIAAGGGKVFTLTGDEAIDAIFYQDGRLTGSAWARLVRRALFDGVRYPVGKLYEDQAVVVPLYGRARQVVVTDEPVYCYRDARAGSILNTFTPARADILDTLEALEREVVPAHCGAVCARLLAAALNLYSLSPAEAQYDSLRERCMSIIKRVRRHCVADGRVRRRDRAAAAFSYLGTPALQLLRLLR